MNGFKTHIDLNILPLGSYDLLIGMDCLDEHRFILNCYNKTLSCLDDKGNTIVQWIPSKVTIREISAIQMKRSVRKGCNFFEVHIMDDRVKNNQVNLEDIPILKYFKDVFLEEILRLPSKR